MIRWLTVVLRLAVAGLKSRRHLLLENLALRHQLLVSSRDMNQANPLGGAPRIHGELLKLGIILAQQTVAKRIILMFLFPLSQDWLHIV